MTSVLPNTKPDAQRFRPAVHIRFKNSDSEFHPENAAVQSKSAVFALSM